MQPLVGWHGYTGATSRARAGTGTISCSVGARPFYKKSPTASCTHKTRGHEKRTCDRTQREAWTDSRKSLHRGKNTQRKLKPTAAAPRHHKMLRCRRCRYHRLPQDNQTTRARPTSHVGKLKHIHQCRRYTGGYKRNSWQSQPTATGSGDGVPRPTKPAAKEQRHAGTRNYAQQHTCTRTCNSASNPALHPVGIRRLAPQTRGHK